MKLKVAHVTTCRSDYGPCFWLLKNLFANQKIQATLLVGGSHLSRRHGYTMAEINEHAWPRVREIPFLTGNDLRIDLSRSCSKALKAFGEYFEQDKPDILILYGDRVELLPIATAAVIHGIPIAHICGGDVTEGAIDEQVRHAITKMAHLHFPSTKLSAERIRQMGEEPWRIHTTGDPALDHFRHSSLASKKELKARLGLSLSEESLLVTLHPETVNPKHNRNLVKELIKALKNWGGTIVITAPAPDPGSEDIRNALEEFASQKPNVIFVESLGSHFYRSLLHYVVAVVGNSSSGLIEAGAVPVPAINIGDRQKGRERGKNVIDAPPLKEKIESALQIASSKSFRKKLILTKNPYGAGNASQKIVEVLISTATSALLKKVFE